MISPLFETSRVTVFSGCMLPAGFQAVFAAGRTLTLPPARRLRDRR